MKLEDYEDFQSAYDLIKMYVPNLTPQDVDFQKYILNFFLLKNNELIPITLIHANFKKKHGTNPLTNQPYYYDFDIYNNTFFTTHADHLLPYLPITLVKDMAGNNNNYNFQFVAELNTNK